MVVPLVQMMRHPNVKFIADYRKTKHMIYWFIDTNGNYVGVNKNVYKKEAPELMKIDRNKPMDILVQVLPNQECKLPRIYELL